MLQLVVLKASTSIICLTENSPHASARCLPCRRQAFPSCALDCPRSPFFPSVSQPHDRLPIVRPAPSFRVPYRLPWSVAIAICPTSSGFAHVPKRPRRPDGDDSPTCCDGIFERLREVQKLRRNGEFEKLLVGFIGLFLQAETEPATQGA